MQSVRYAVASVEEYSFLSRLKTHLFILAFDID